ncbi:hypothetical protein, partial [Sphingomonas kyeonggiensis]|uniref:hypothetical protein n=1 Tax=Sphingomonas kyeonggiensis TaxID=1268553 RepID=UPI0027D8975F
FRQEHRVGGVASMPDLPTRQQPFATFCLFLEIEQKTPAFPRLLAFRAGSQNDASMTIPARITPNQPRKAIRIAESGIRFPPAKLRKSAAIGGLRRIKRNGRIART